MRCRAMAGAWHLESAASRTLGVKFAACNKLRCCNKCSLADPFAPGHGVGSRRAAVRNASSVVHPARLVSRRANDLALFVPYSTETSPLRLLHHIVFDNRERQRVIAARTHQDRSESAGCAATNERRAKRSA